jgi:hypothetical protein
LADSTWHVQGVKKIPDPFNMDLPQEQLLQFFRKYQPELETNLGMFALDKKTFKPASCSQCAGCQSFFSI